MSIGTGIFLGCALVALVMLFLKTRNQWNWRRIGLVLAAVFIALPILSISGIYVKERWDARPQKQTKYWDISVGDRVADVLFKKGKPSMRPEAPPDPTAWVYAYKSGGEFIPTVDKEHDDAAEVYQIRFKNGRVRFVGKVFGSMSPIENLGGINAGSTLEEIIKVLGEPSRVSRSKSETSRIYSFDKYQVAFQFEAGAMHEQFVYDVSTGPLRYEGEAK